MVMVSDLGQDVVAKLEECVDVRLMCSTFVELRVKGAVTICSMRLHF